jgi:hypothetical protein
MKIYQTAQKILVGNTQEGQTAELISPLSAVRKSKLNVRVINSAKKLTYLTSILKLIC